ncbi:TrkA-N domain-containing protein [Candidatus Magnetoovum chiemensis]|nr:TrkA-N domain-containing protein [Candidatus Magnetoovum chiemensis]
MRRNKFIIIGLGNVGQNLLKKLSKEYELTCIDITEAAYEQSKKIRSDINIIIGDATSRLILEQAQVNDADGVIITTTNEKTNIETARVLKQYFSAKRIISIGLTSAGNEALQEMGIEVENIFNAGAVMIRNLLEQKSRTVYAIGLGKNEILEVEVHPNSKIANKPISSFAPLRWRIGIIYRADNIIVPNPDTILKPKDKVVILGEPAVIKTVSEILTFNFQQFPLEYGNKVIVYINGKEGEEFYNELSYIFSLFPLKKLILAAPFKIDKYFNKISQLIKREPLPDFEIIKNSLPVIDAMENAIELINKEQGLIIISKKTLFSLFFSSNAKKRFIHDLSKKAACPIFILNGTYPYEKTSVPCVKHIRLQSVLETVLEIAVSVNNSVSALLVEPSKYIDSDEEIEEFERNRKIVSDTSLLYKLSINTNIYIGNPVKVITAALDGSNLLAIDAAPWSRVRFASALNPDILWHIFKGSKLSVLIVPQVEESL